MMGMVRGTTNLVDAGFTTT